MPCPSIRGLVSFVALSTALLACQKDSTPPESSSKATTSAATADPAAAAPAAAPTPTVANPAAATAEPTAAGELEVGKPAPELKAKAHDGSAIQLSALKGKSVVVYFYPKDETPGCTKEACSFRDAWNQLGKKAVMIGVSADDDASHKKFAEHHKLPFLLVSDPDGAIAKSFNVPFVGGLTKRQTVVIGPDGNVKKIYRTVDVTKHAAEIQGDIG
ncbi:peroxiredoxin [Pendulispora rubella]|uniref:thioredoxin-dependent peroxiredoxin n=1 Tax=Pendulispora rubella TaxID=2741070 RepID=A0ABZ2KZD7_9BACT